MIINVVGARPNLMKMAPVVRELDRRAVANRLVHTGQHYDPALSEKLFDELEIRKPEVNLGVGSDTHARQTARVLEGFETVCARERPSLVVVAGDVNSTAAAALVAAKMNIPVAHVEAGLRSFDRSMPEEVNRVVTDHLASLLFTTEESANENLSREGIDGESVHFVGNTMIDSLSRYRDRAVSGRPWERWGVDEGAYLLVTLHRPSNVDDREALEEIALALSRLAESTPVLFPVHPRTRQAIDRFGVDFGRTTLVGALAYLEFVGTMARAGAVLTDSGGIQEETTALGIPCLTLRPNTERPVTIHEGTNRLLERTADGIVAAVNEAMTESRRPVAPKLWDGRAAKRVVDVLNQFTSEARR